MKFNNLPAKVKRSPEQKAIAAYKSRNTYVALQIVLEDMTVEESVRFFIHALKNTKFKTYRLGIENLENAVESFFLTKDPGILTKFQKTLGDSNDAFSSVCMGIATLLTSKETLDFSWVSNIPIITYETSYGEDYPRHMISDLLAFKYNNTSFRLLYGN